MTENTKKRGRPPMKSETQKELDKLEKQFDDFEDNNKKLLENRERKAPISNEEPQTKLSQKEIANTDDTYLKPVRVISSPQKFNEKYREKMEFQKEYVKFIAENKEIIGESIEIWTRPFGGMPAEFWRVPVNKPVWGPRYLAEQIKRKYYHRMVMDDTVKNQDGFATFYGSMAVDKCVQRLDAYPVVENKRSVFMGAS